MHKMEIASPGDLGFSPARLKRIGAVMQGYIDQGKIAGTVTLIARHGRIAYLEALGRMDIASGKPMQPDTIFRIASMTKLMTVVSVMMLFEEGHFLLDDPVAEFLPDFAGIRVFVREIPDGIETADLQRPITIRHLLMHTSGLAYGGDGTPVERIYEREQIPRPGEPLARQVARITHLPLAHEPGAGWTYGYSHDVLARLVEVVSGESFDAFLKQRIFDPLAMTDTGFWVPPQEQGRLATVYALGADGTLTVRDLPVASEATGATVCGGSRLLSTAADYAQVCQMLLNGGNLDAAQLLGRKTVALMTANQMAGEDTPFGLGVPLPGGRHGWRMGLGVGVVTDAAKTGMPLSVGSYTWAGAWGTLFWIDPAEDLYGVFMVQQAPGPFWPRPAHSLIPLTYQALS